MSATAEAPTMRRFRLMRGAHVDDTPGVPKHIKDPDNQRKMIRNPECQERYFQASAPGHPSNCDIIETDQNLLDLNAQGGGELKFVLLGSEPVLGQNIATASEEELLKQLEVIRARKAGAPASTTQSPAGPVGGKANNAAMVASFEKMSVKELTEYAEGEEIELGAAKEKPAIIAALKKHLGVA